MKSWNFNPQVQHRGTMSLEPSSKYLAEKDGSLLVFGNGRSYGDVCLNADGHLLLSKSLNRFISFDKVTGRLVCESGVLLKDILEVCVPKGWFLPVVPGTQFVTVGGAIANDVHGKNHHTQGSFGDHVVQFELLRSDGERKQCSLVQEPDWFRATIGGLGLTGALIWAELQLMPVTSPFVSTQSIRFANLDEYWQLNAKLQQRWHYNVAWIDCLATGSALGRGILSSASHGHRADRCLPKWQEKAYQFPLTPPISLVNQPSLKAFNSLYYHRPISEAIVNQHYIPYFFPLDSIQNWNRMYGKRGFYQYQCVIPRDQEQSAVKALLEVISQRKQGSFLAVLKSFGDRPASGMLSFPREGATLALDFPNLGRQTHQLFAVLDGIVSQAGGALYPAKDARMSASMFQQAFPSFETFQSYIDPKFSSSFWRRVVE
ncbi:FAD-binding oxidoreductase [Marinomonas gallaica]|uniref:FAD-binding oxidoreductase n=1 Tax=Marinomonas gallaica TaxID=1806667 RepID=UPI003A939F56